MREAAADTAGAVRGFFFPILIDCAGNTKGGASSPKGGKRVTARPEVPPLFSALIRRHALGRQCSLARMPVSRSVSRRASCLPPGGKRETISGRGGVGSRERLRLDCYPAVPALLAGCRCQAPDAGLFHLAGAWSRPSQAVESWAGEEIRPRRPRFHSTLPPSRQQPPPVLPRASRSRSRRLALPEGRRRSAPGLPLRPLQQLSKPDPPHEPGGRELVLGETPPPRLEEDFLSHTFSS
ncbi:uncharacterized protein LOC121030714 [Herpailurus yagouaroundi]|uniref:uncharacterized protein LOC121030714 n=1 Tax=Herpailurus yagouaroundi TaxID=1608482 RepID=UPI001AD7359D|nr:uncharacterized protein LOC121030714 [Puma yagouaroundi]